MEKPELKKVFERAATIIKEEKEICQHCDTACDPKVDGDSFSTAVSDWKDEKPSKPPKPEPCQHCDTACDPKVDGDSLSTAVSDWKEERAK